MGGGAGGNHRLMPFYLFFFIYLYFWSQSFCRKTGLIQYFQLKDLDLYKWIVYFSWTAFVLRHIIFFHISFEKCFWKSKPNLHWKYCGHESQIYSLFLRMAYLELEDNEQSRECYRKALELDPNNQNYKNNLEMVEQKLREQAIGVSSWSYLFIYLYSL